MAYLAPRPNQNFVDATVGLAGHTREILRRTAPHGKVLALDRDPEVANYLKKNLPASRTIVVTGNFADLDRIVRECHFGPVQGVLFDLGFSLAQVKDANRGFSFQQDGPLDMRFDRRQKLTAQEIVNRFSQAELYQIIKSYGEEKNAAKIAQAIVRERKRKPIRSTLELVEVIRKAIPARGWYRQKIHFATRTFQALRIAVNDELRCLEKGLAAALKITEPGGKIVVLAFHSGEDRIVKNFFRSYQKKLKILTKKPIRPSTEEIQQNPRSRSARLRCAQKI